LWSITLGRIFHSQKFTMKYLVLISLILTTKVSAALMPIANVAPETNDDMEDSITKPCSIPGTHGCPIPHAESVGNISTDHNHPEVNQTRSSVNSTSSDPHSVPNGSSPHGVNIPMHEPVVSLTPVALDPHTHGARNITNSSTSTNSTLQGKTHRNTKLNTTNHTANHTKPSDSQLVSTQPVLPAMKALKPQSKLLSSRPQIPSDVDYHNEIHQMKLPVSASLPLFDDHADPPVGNYIPNHKELTSSFPVGKPATESSTKLLSSQKEVTGPYSGVPVYKTLTEPTMSKIVAQPKDNTMTDPTVYRTAFEAKEIPLSIGQTKLAMYQPESKIQFFPGQNFEFQGIKSFDDSFFNLARPSRVNSSPAQKNPNTSPPTIEYPIFQMMKSPYVENDFPAMYRIPSSKPISFSSLPSTMSNYRERFPKTEMTYNEIGDPKRFSFEGQLGESSESFPEYELLEKPRVQNAMVQKIRNKNP
jgi:hypothetical protein